jgi:hypothetical protein
MFREVHREELKDGTDHAANFRSKLRSGEIITEGKR